MAEKAVGRRLFWEEDWWWVEARRVREV